MSLKVLSPGLQTLLVDRGRPGSRSLGVPVGGAADAFSMALGNGLVGNPRDAVALEINLAGPTFESDSSLHCVLWGARFEAYRNERPLRAGYTFNLDAGDILRIGGSKDGARAYLCVRGSFDVPTILASKSALGPLRINDELSCQSSRSPGRSVRDHWDWSREPLVMRFISGGQASWFSQSELVGQEYAVAPASNRMGLRLAGTPLTHTLNEIVSEPVCPGTVQVTRDGQCIILGVDGQTIGGYPKIAQVISADLDKLGQLRSGDRFRFQQVSIEKAEEIYRLKRAELDEWLMRLAETARI